MMKVYLLPERAFPSSYVDPQDGNEYITHGMTLRDYFAASVIRGFLPCTDGTTPRIEDVVRVGYEFADAMLKEREK